MYKARISHTPWALVLLGIHRPWLGPPFLTGLKNCKCPLPPLRLSVLQPPNYPGVGLALGSQHCSKQCVQSIFPLLCAWCIPENSSLFHLALISSFFLIFCAASPIKVKSIRRTESSCQTITCNILRQRMLYTIIEKDEFFVSLTESILTAILIHWALILISFLGELNTCWLIWN